MTTERQIGKGISDIVGALTDPIIVFPGGWGDTIPDWLKNAITLERMLGNMSQTNGGDLTGTDAEACAYLMTVSLTRSMDSDWIQIYMYVAGKTSKRWNKTEMPADIAVDSISNYQMEKLKRLKDWIYQQRVKARLEKDKAEHRQSTEIQKEAEQPALFAF